MIEKDLKLRSCITQFYEKHRQQPCNACNHESNCHTNVLSCEDWQILSNIYLILKSFWDFIKRIEGYTKTGKYVALWRILIGIESMSRKMNKHKVDYSHLIDEGEDKWFIFTSINNSLTILDKYCGLISDSLVYYTAIIANLSLKLELFQ